MPSDQIAAHSTDPTTKGERTRLQIRKEFIQIRRDPRTLALE